MNQPIPVSIQGITSTVPLGLVLALAPAKSLHSTLSRFLSTAVGKAAQEPGTLDLEAVLLKVGPIPSSLAGAVHAVCHGEDWKEEEKVEAT